MISFLCICVFSAPPVPSVHLLTTWRDVFLSEKVKLECRISSSADYTFSWTRDGRDVTASDSTVSLAGDGSQLTLTMGEPESSSGSYTCKALHKATGSLAVAANSETLRVLGEWKGLLLCRSVLRGTMTSVPLCCSRKEATANPAHRVRPGNHVPRRIYYLHLLAGRFLGLGLHLGTQLDCNRPFSQHVYNSCSRLF